VHLPIQGGYDLNQANAQKLDQCLNAAGDQPILVHCMSGNRVGALFALRAYWLQGASPEQALAIGLKYGLTKLEPVIRQMLGL
jgi:protein tyrosine phosphatase (PTP) superfamily phosphohydrolase (DUF442 family)